MEKLFKNITVIGQEVYAEMNREICQEDFILAKETEVEITDTENGKGKTLQKAGTYRMNKRTADELSDYFKHFTSNEKINVLEYSDESKDDLWISTMIEFSIISKHDIDFRGCRTDQNKTDKLNSSIQDITREYEHTTNLIIPSKYEKINNKIKSFVEFYNNQFIYSVTKQFTSDSNFQEEFADSIEVDKLNTIVVELTEQISELNEERKVHKNKLAIEKRKVVNDLMEKNKWCIEGDNNEKVQLPDAVIEKAKEAINKSFDNLIIIN